MRIGEFARRGGVGIDTVRYYEHEGLLPRAQRLGSGHRSYDAQALQHLGFIRRAKALGFSLPEIRELLRLLGNQGRDMAGLREASRRKLADVDARLAELQRIRSGLSALVEDCPGQGPIGDCPILHALAGAQA